MHTKVSVSLFAASLLTAAAFAAEVNPRPKHVVFIGLDGLSSTSLRAGARAPQIRKFMKEGAWTLSARTVLPSSSDSNWASMFQCAGPELTGRDCTRDNVPEPPFAPAVTNANGRFPDVVSTFRAARPGAKIGYFFEWGGMRYLLDTNAADRVQWGSADRDVADWAADYFRAEKPELTILVINSPDDVGHTFGWESSEYQARVPELDGRLAKLVRAVEESGALNDTVFVVTSDHGGRRKSHGGTSLDELERPLVFAGKGVKRGYQITGVNASYDVGATLAWLLDVPRPQVWTGRPIVEAFEGNAAAPDDNQKVARTPARAKHVVFCGFDGLNAVCFRRGVEAPTFRRLMAEGAWTLKSRSVLPSSSCCNWGTIFLCAGPELHGCDAVSNPLPAFRPAETLKANLRFPDVFHRVRKAYGGEGRIGFFYEWGGVFQVIEPTSPDLVVHGSNLRDIADSAADFFLKWKPQLMSVVFNQPDDAGHAFGHESKEYDATVTKLDARFRRVYAAVEKAGALDETVFILTSDHGGVGKGHGGHSPAEMERPLIIFGKGVKKGFEITDSTASYDVGATIAWILGVEPAAAWRGRPVTSAFAD